MRPRQNGQAAYQDNPPPATRFAADDANRRDGGFIMAQTALLMVPLMIFAAFATDIGAWYLQGQRVQRAADAAAMAAVVHLPDQGRAEEVARELAAKNGFADATPGDNSDFETGPTPQVRVVFSGRRQVEVEIRTEATSYFGKLVLDSIDIERYAVAEHVRSVHLGNPTSGLGTGHIPQSQLGVPPDKVWLVGTAYCDPRGWGDPFAVRGAGTNVLSGMSCGPTPYTYPSDTVDNPTFDPDAYVFVVEASAGTPAIDIDVYEPGTGCSGGTNDDYRAPRIVFELYGPSRTVSHRNFIESSTPIATVSHPTDSCISNSPNGDGWWPLATGLPNPSADGGFYYIKAYTRHPGSYDPDPGDSFWGERGYNSYSLRTRRAGYGNSLCVFSSADPTCPQVYALEWFEMLRNIGNTQETFYLAEVGEQHAGETLTITFYDASEGTQNVSFENPDGQAVPFQWRYADTTIGLMSGYHYRETSFGDQPYSTCSWKGTSGNPCLNTSTHWTNWDSHFVEVKIDIPDDYSCGTDCWWRIRYSSGVTTIDRSTWSVTLDGDPVRLLE